MHKVFGSDSAGGVNHVHQEMRLVMIKLGRKRFVLGGGREESMNVLNAPSTCLPPRSFSFLRKPETDTIGTIQVYI